MKKLVYLFIIILVLASVGCNKKSDSATVPPFSGQRAYALLERQIALGPRNPDSEGWKDFQSMMAEFCDSLECQYQIQKFQFYDLSLDDTIDLANWILKIDPEANERILIAAHYDSRPRAENDRDSTVRQQPIPGANDGASGTAVLMHMAELMKANPPHIGVDLVLFDGEDYGPPDRLDQYLIGSAYFARNNKTKYRYGILLDMVGDRDLQIYRESLSDRYEKELNDKIWNTAASMGMTAFVDSVKYTVYDDHLSLMAGGIRAVDVIDLDYPWWHTQADTPDKCSPASLEAVGRVIMEVIYNEK